VCPSAPADAPRRSKRIGGCECHGPGTCYSFNGDAIDALLMASTTPRRERVSGRTGCRSTRILADLWRDTCVLLCAPKLEHRVPVGPSERETGICIHSRRPVAVLTSARAFYRRALKQSPCSLFLMDGMGTIVFGFMRSRNLIDRPTGRIESASSRFLGPRARLFSVSRSIRGNTYLTRCRIYSFSRAPVRVYTVRAYNVCKE
jgi:hypothetical protein